MDFEEEVTQRMQQASEHVVAHPDLASVLVEAGARKQRTRMVAAAGAAGIVALGVVGVFVAADRDTGSVDRNAASADAPDSGEYFVPDPNAPDPALEFLDQTTEVYQRMMPSGYNLSVRLSDVSYGELFDSVWSAPTGSVQECLAGPAAFIGDPDGDRIGYSSWIARHWFALDDTLDDQPGTGLGDQQNVSVEEFFPPQSEAGVSFVVVRSSLPIVEAGVAGIGIDEDRADSQNGVVALEIRRASVAGEEGPASTGPVETPPVVTTLSGLEVPGFRPMISLVFESESPSYSEFAEFALDGVFEGQRQRPADCQGGLPPWQALPGPGEQPVDALAAESEIRDVHAVLVDRSVAAEDKPGNLLDDNRGVSEARDQMEGGPFAESASEAKYTLEEFVFTDPQNAWFRYTIDAPTGLFPDRFGQAVFNGDVWQITRQTICQDLSLAQGYCDPDNGPTPVLQPGVPEDIQAESEQYRELYQLYERQFTCNPLVPC